MKSMIETYNFLLFVWKPYIGLDFFFFWLKWNTVKEGRFGNYVNLTDFKKKKKE